MGYDLHITRRRYWSDRGDDIPFEEFVHLVQKDEEFRYPGENGNGYADWHAPEGSYTSWLCWSDGEIYTKNPEPVFIDKMMVIARALRAQVQGDDGEVYLSATEIQQPKASPTATKTSQARSLLEFSEWPLWVQLIAAFLLGCVLLALQLLIFGR